MKILLAIDGSKFSEAAAKAVAREYQPQEAEVKLLHVVDIPLPIPTSDAAGYREESLKHGEELLQRTAQELISAGYKVSKSLEEGDPRSKIIDNAAHWGADLIVVGSHGRKGLERFLMGSVAEFVVRHARCSVEVVRSPD